MGPLPPGPVWYLRYWTPSISTYASGNAISYDGSGSSYADTEFPYCHMTSYDVIWQFSICCLSIYWYIQYRNLHVWDGNDSISRHMTVYHISGKVHASIDWYILVHTGTTVYILFLLFCPLLHPAGPPESSGPASAKRHLFQATTSFKLFFHAFLWLLLAAAQPAAAAGGGRRRRRRRSSSSSRRRHPLVANSMVTLSGATNLHLKVVPERLPSWGCPHSRQVQWWICDGRGCAALMLMLHRR
jgi:hypothetical protein